MKLTEKCRLDRLVSVPLAQESRSFWRLLAVKILRIPRTAKQFLRKSQLLDVAWVCANFGTNTPLSKKQWWEYWSFIVGNGHPDKITLPFRLWFSQFLERSVMPNTFEPGTTMEINDWYSRRLQATSLRQRSWSLKSCNCEKTLPQQRPFNTNSASFGLSSNDFGMS